MVTTATTTAPTTPRRLALLAWASCASPLLLQACASKPASPTQPGKPAAANPATPATAAAAPLATPVPAADAATPERRAASALSSERQWLQSWFAGTPVAIAEREDGAISIDVPKEFCFTDGDSKIKPPLVAVLDKVAQSLRRTPAARLALVAGPEDKAGTAALALQRANKVRSHVVSRGVNATRLAPASSTLVAAVQLRMDVAPAP
jgi:outer membrane protein OmpA-like peptidoglycan-associated protein